YCVPQLPRQFGAGKVLWSHAGPRCALAYDDWRYREPSLLQLLDIGEYSLVRLVIPLLLIELRCLLEVLKRTALVTEFSPDDAPVIVGLRLVRFEADGLRIILQGALLIPQLITRIAPVAVGIGILRFQLDHVRVILNDALPVVKVIVGVSPVGVQIRLIGVEP